MPPALCSTRFHGLVDRPLVSDVQVHGRGETAQLLGRPLRAGKIDVADRHPRAFLDVGFGEGAADTARRPRDQRRFAFQPHAAIAFPSAPKRCSLVGSGVR